MTKAKMNKDGLCKVDAGNLGTCDDEAHNLYKWMFDMFVSVCFIFVWYFLHEF